MAATLGLLVTAACGSSSSTKTASATSSSVAGVVSSTASTSAPHFSGSSSSKFCDQARNLNDQTKLNPSGDLKTAFAHFDELANQVLSSAPSAIKGDMSTLVEGLRTLKNALAAANYDYSKMDPNAIKSLQDPKFQASSQRVEAYLTQVCGIKTGSSSSAP
jgi:hypothetical protein